MFHSRKISVFATTVSAAAALSAYNLSVRPSSLPPSYNKPAINKFFYHRPLAVVSRIAVTTTKLYPILRAINSHVNTNTNANTTTSIDSQTATHFKDSLVSLGPAWVKFGQNLSIRPDLVPQVLIDELLTLCDAVPKFDDEIALETIRSELSLTSLSEEFTNIEFVASASIGQVYRATLRNAPKPNTQVAIKVQRPYMKQSISLDLFILDKASMLIDLLLSLTTQQTPFLRNFMDSFFAGAYSEVDYLNEAANQEFFRSEFRSRKMLNKIVHIPATYPQLTTDKVLVSEWMEGVKMSDITNPTTVKRLIPIGVELFTTMLLDIGKFHADPHIGNLLVNPQNELILLDFGLCCDISLQERNDITVAMKNLLMGNYEELINVNARQLKFLSPDVDTTTILPILKSILTTTLLDNNITNRNKSLAKISSDLNQLFFEFEFTVPPFFALLTRGLVLLEGIACKYDTDFNLFHASWPAVKKRAFQILISPNSSRDKQLR